MTIIKEVGHIRFSGMGCETRGVSTSALMKREDPMPDFVSFYIVFRRIWID